jgi:hypothetical protein
MGEN